MPTGQYQPRPIVVDGDRIYLSNFVQSDVPTLTAWFQQLEVTAYVGMQGTSFVVEQEQLWYDSYVKPSETVQHFAVIDKQTHRLIGNVSLMDIRQIHQRAELGIVIGERDCWGKGYGREATRLMCQYGFVFRNLHTIYLWYVSYNERARKSYEAAGFRETGRIPQARLFNGKRYDDVVMTVTADDGAANLLLGQYGQLPV